MSMPTPVLSREVGMTNLLINGNRTNLFRDGRTAAHSKAGRVSSTMWQYPFMSSSLLFVRHWLCLRFGVAVVGPSLWSRIGVFALS